MRPDAHKQKRSASYQKKHGMVPRKRGRRQDEDGEPADAAGAQQAVPPPGTAVTTGPAAAISAAAQAAEDAAAAEAARVAMRELPPTGHGSEDDEDDSEDELIGLKRPAPAWRQLGMREDPALPSGLAPSVYAKPVAHFRLQSELDWNLSGSSSKQAMKVLNIDTSALSATLACIPAQERLGIASSHFSAAELAEFASVAAQAQIPLAAAQAISPRQMSPLDPQPPKQQQQQQPTPQQPQTQQEMPAARKEPQQQEPAKAVKKDDLEDWLDSVI